MIADLLHRIEYIEKAGTGIRRMREAVREHGSPALVFESTGFFTAIFRPLGPSTPEVVPEVTPEVDAPQATPKVAGQVAGQVTGEVLRL
jgi:ATP-dependent DNA helicase RecG